MAVSKVNLEIALCPVCSASNLFTLFDIKDTFATYSVNTCKTCGLSLTSPRPDLATIGVYYDAANYTPFVSSSGQSSLFAKLYAGIRYHSLEWKKRKISRVSEKGKLLDLGCGTGEFLYTMKQSGWTVSGLEPSESASNHARQKIGLDVKTDMINEKSLSEFKATFDVITMWHVLEHLHEPISALNAIKNLMKDDGYLILGLPNRGNWDASIYGEDWVAYDVPRHLFHFTPQSLDKLMDLCNLKVVKKQTIPLDTIFNAVMSEKNILAKAIWKIPLSFIRMAIVIPIALLYGITFKRGSGMLYHIVKK